MFYFLWNRNKNIKISPEVCKKPQKTHKQKAESCLEKCLMSHLIQNFIFQLFLILYQFLDWRWWFEQQQCIHLFLFEEFEDPKRKEFINLPWNRQSWYSWKFMKIPQKGTKKGPKNRFKPDQKRTFLRCFGVPKRTLHLIEFISF